MQLRSDSYKELESCRPFQVLQNALAKNSLGHAIILHGSNFEALEAVCLDLAHSILENKYSSVEGHPDFFAIRPINKMRQINVEITRELVKKLQHTAQEGSRKVAVIYEADRMNASAANAFLKTLEEPPQGTIIFLLTTKPYSLLDTIRSRCLNFSLPVSAEGIQDEKWKEWLEKYSIWTQKVQVRPSSKKEATALIMSIYTMITEFDVVLKRLTKSALENKEEAEETENLEDNEETAFKAGIEKRMRSRLFTELAVATRDAAPLSPRLPRVIQALERHANLLEVNLNELAALEGFLHQALKGWSSPY